MTCDLSYFRRRASEERTAVLHSRDPRVRRVHLAMAECYEEMVRFLAAGQNPGAPESAPLQSVLPVQ